MRNTSLKKSQKRTKVEPANKVLSDPQKRQFYDTHGTVQSNNFVDPAAFFKQQFGGDKFTDIIGEISIAKDFGDAVTEQSEPRKINYEERLEKRRERVAALELKLSSKLALFSDSFPVISDPDFPIREVEKEALNNFRVVAEIEANTLKTESYGKELLHAIGYTYVSKAEQWQASLDSEHGDLFKMAWGGYM